MPDITMCPGEKDDVVCLNRDACYRFTATPNEYRQSYFQVAPFDTPDKCEYLDNENREYRG